MVRAICRCIGLGVICFALTVQAEDLDTVRRSAEQGEVSAQFDLGLRYANGRGVARDADEAAKWYRKAAGRQE